MKLALTTALAAAVALFSAGARAQSPQASAPPPPSTHATGDYVEQNLGGDAIVTFVGDELTTPPGGAYGDVIRRPPGVIRALLIRPRMNFVVEMLKSVENL